MIEVLGNLDRAPAGVDANEGRSVDRSAMLAAIGRS
jgi:hypothetical protein